MEKEQSSILTPSQKIKVPKKKLVGVESKKEEPKLPKPTGWRLLVLPFKMKEKTKGGVILAETYFRETASCITSWFSNGHGFSML